MNRIFVAMSYKFWLESRVRFLIAFLLLTAIIFYAVSQAGGTIQQHPSTHGGRYIVFSQYVWVIIYKGDFLSVFTFAAFIFGLGGPMQEKQTGSASFTLSLPIFRRTILRAKIIVAACQIILLSALAALTIPLAAAVYGFRYPLKDALLFGCLLATGGLLFMLLGLYLSMFITRQLLVPALGIAIMATFFSLPGSRPLSISIYLTS